MKRSLIDIYKLLDDKPLHEQEETEFEKYSKEKKNLKIKDLPGGGKYVDKEEGNFHEETIEIEIPGVEGKTEVKIKHPAADDDRALQGVTITFMHEGDEVEQYTDIDFEADDMVEDHDNKGQDWIFVAEGDGITFEVEVSVEASYQESGNIQAIHWSGEGGREPLTVTYDDQGESLDERKSTTRKVKDQPFPGIGEGSDTEETNEASPKSRYDKRPWWKQLLGIDEELVKELRLKYVVFKLLIF